MPQTPAFRLGYWIKLGWVSFGGPATQISLMHQDVVQHDRAITESEFQRGLSLCMLLPGPEAQQLATYLGLRLGGWRGAVLAGLSFILPGLLLMGLFAGLYQHNQTPGWIETLSHLYPPVLALSLLAGWKLARRSCRDTLGACCIGLGYLAVLGQIITLPSLMLLLGIFGLCYQYWNSRGSARRPQTDSILISPLYQASHIKLVLGFLLAYGLPLVVLYVLNPVGSAWWSLAWVSVEMATLSFGGAYVVLPLFVARAVHDYQWVTIDTLLLALTLSELTPGPLVLVVCFVGFLVGANAVTPIGALWGGVGGLLLAAYFLFLPSFVCVLLFAPLIHSPWINTHLEGLFAGLGNAAVAGLLAMLTHWVLSSSNAYSSNAFGVSGAIAVVSLGLFLRWPSFRIAILLSMGFLHWAISRMA